MIETRRQKSESLLLGVLLAAAGGFLETYTLIGRGGVFANCQTGNLVLLALSLSEGKLETAPRYLTPILAFFAGIFLTESVRRLPRFASRLHWRQIVLLFEALCLAVCAFLPAGQADAAVTTVISFVCAMQVEAFRKVKGNPFATTMCTGNLRSMSEHLYACLRTGDRQAGARSLHYLLIVLTFSCGAAAGAALTGLFAERAVLLCCLPLLAGVRMMTATEREEAAAPGALRSGQ